MVQRDLSDLPPAESEVPVSLAVRNDLLPSRLMEAVLRERMDAPDREIVGGALLRASQAGSCTRAVAYDLAGVEKQDHTMATHWRFWTGQMTHDQIDEVLPKAFPPDKYEVVIEPEGMYIGGPVSIGLHGDSTIRNLETGKKIAGEWKSVGGYKFKLVTVGMKGKVEGPSWDHVEQLALATVALDCDEGHLLYVALENINKKWAADAGLPEWGAAMKGWSISRSDADTIAMKAALRMAVAVDTDVDLALVTDDEGNTVRIVNPITGAWVDPEDPHRTGQTWRCNYCDHADTCRSQHSS